MSSVRKDGFHIVVLVRDTSIDIALLAVSSGKFSQVASTSVPHRITPKNGFTPEQLQNFSSLLGKSFESLGQLIKKKLGKTARIRIHSAQCIMFYPWYTIENKDDIRIGKTDERVKLTQKGIDEALKNIATSSLPAEHPMAAYTYRKTIIESFVNSIRLNGYSVSNPVGKESKDIRLKVSLYTAAAGALDILRKEIEFHTGCKPEIFTLPKAIAAQGAATTSGKTVFINIEGENTNVISVSPGSSSVYASVSIDIGLDDIAHKVMEKTSVSREIALSYIRLSHEDALSESASRAVSGAVQESLALWNEEVARALRELETFDSAKKIMSRYPEFSTIFSQNLHLIGSEISSVEKMIFDSVSV